VGDGAHYAFQIGGRGVKERIWIVISVLLLCGAGAESRRFRPPPDATAYRAKVKAATEAMPRVMGNWRGQDVPVERAAVMLLHPNVIVSRRYVNRLNGATVDLLLVDCEDARDTIGHYPPICYPSQGWSLQLTKPMDWKLAHRVVHGTEYTFVRGIFDRNGSQVVDDFFVLPEVGTAPDRGAVIAAAGDLSRRFYGVAQVQLVFPGEYASEQREQMFGELMGPLEGLIESIQTVQEHGKGDVK
jgi:Protein of unknown function (DUF3485)